MKLINKLSIVVSVYNEEAVLDKFYETILPILEEIDSDYELIFVNDGSRDASPAILDRLAMDSKKVKVIHFSRNYGHEAAMIAGIDYSSGDGIVCVSILISSSLISISIRLLRQSVSRISRQELLFSVRMSVLST